MRNHMTETHHTKKSPKENCELLTLVKRQLLSNEMFYQANAFVMRQIQGFMQRNTNKIQAIPSMADYMIGSMLAFFVKN